MKAGEFMREKFNRMGDHKNGPGMSENKTISESFRFPIHPHLSYPTTPKKIQPNPHPTSPASRPHHYVHGSDITQENPVGKNRSLFFFKKSSVKKITKNGSRSELLYRFQIPRFREIQKPLHSIPSGKVSGRRNIHRHRKSILLCNSSIVG